MSLTPNAYQDINWDGVVIPKGTMILINARAGNHEVEYFGRVAATLNSERWLSNLSPPTETQATGLQRLSFGAGSRACSGQFIPSRMLYSALVRLITISKIVASETELPNTDYVDYNQFRSALVAIPRDFKVKLIPRDAGVTTEVLEKAERGTRDTYA